MSLPDSPTKPTLLFAMTMFLSAALLFFVQPLFSKLVLPYFGGTPAVWNTCLVFFQAMLLAGYFYAQVVNSWLNVRRQVALHTLVLLIPLTILPIAVSKDWVPSSSSSPVFWLLGLLTVAVGLPFFVVATNAPLLQAWYARSSPDANRDPYFLYSASNVGSLGILIAYPFVVEPSFSLRTQSVIWACGYVVLVILVVLCGVRVWFGQCQAVDSDHRSRVDRPRSSVTNWMRLRWVLLALVPSSLMLGVTLYLTSDIASLPLLWVLPLGLYLLTFIFSFARVQLLPLAMMARIMPLFVVVIVIVLVSEATHPAWLLVLLHLATLFVTSMVCHGELARSRPPVEHLTEFYLCQSVGGVAGGLLSGLIAPWMFRSVAEYPLALVAACLLRPAMDSDSGECTTNSKIDDGHRFDSAYLDVLLPLALGMLTFFLVVVSSSLGISGTPGLAVALGLPLIICYGFLFWPVRFGLGIAAVLLAAQFRAGVHGDVLLARRSFYGIHRVTADSTGRFVQLVHGSTVHGMQMRRVPAADLNQDVVDDPQLDPQPEPLTYYHRSGPIGDVFTLSEIGQTKLPVAVVGLGTGSLASYMNSGQQIDFYEIDPIVQSIAEDRRYFTFLGQCQGVVRIIIGDARLKLAESASGRYGLIMVDAFSSDAVPVHLMTREALRLYLSKLATKGIIAFNVSSRYLDLQPVLADLARDCGLVSYVREDLEITSLDRQQGKWPSIWVVLTRQPADLGELTYNRQWEMLIGRPDGVPWTDDYANVLGAFRWD